MIALVYVSINITRFVVSNIVMISLLDRGVTRQTGL